ncbi:MAG: hypothetical protein OEQ39_04995 [Gammaproteobacteria bacterium]|nr:hypothetical protein [Gammaproteobacteria bacterium]MDH3464316.1 hypothetical protein [Gammaproteobacteria bacterium]
MKAWIFSDERPASMFRRNIATELVVYRHMSYGITAQPTEDMGYERCSTSASTAQSATRLLELLTLAEMKFAF